MEVAIQGVTDLCAHQNELWEANGSWLHRSFVKLIKALQFSEETAVEICVFKNQIVEVHYFRSATASSEIAV
jgi:agmatine/peptidylarginine deiminase